MQQHSACWFFNKFQIYFYFLVLLQRTHARVYVWMYLGNTSAWKGGGTWSLARFSLSRMWEVTILSVSSRSMGKISNCKAAAKTHFSQNFIPEFNFSATTLRLHGGVTLVEHWRTVLISSWMTMSTHLTQGCFSLMICFFTIASNAMSGVKSPVLQREEEEKTGVAKSVFFHFKRCFLYGFCFPQNKLWPWCCHLVLWRHWS